MNSLPQAGSGVVRVGTRPTPTDIAGGPAALLTLTDPVQSTDLSADSDCSRLWGSGDLGRDRRTVERGVGKWKSADKPGSVDGHHLHGGRGQSFIWALRYRSALAAYPGTTRATSMFPYLALPRMGFTVPATVASAAVGSYPPACGRHALLRHPFTLACAAHAAIGGLLSVALSVASRRPAVNRHPALRGPDFPPRAMRAATAWRTSAADYTRSVTGKRARGKIQRTSASAAMKTGSP